MVRGIYSYDHRADLFSTMFQIPLMIHRLQRQHETQLPASSLSFSAWIIAQTFGFYILVVVIIIDDPHLRIGSMAGLSFCYQRIFLQQQIKVFKIYTAPSIHICKSLGFIATADVTVKEKIKLDITWIPTLIVIYWINWDLQYEQFITLIACCP